MNFADLPPLPILLGAAIIDSINPCAFGVLIFMLAYLTKTFKNNRALFLLHGLIYILAVFLTYLLAGLLLMPIIGSLGQTSLIFYAIIGVVVVIAGVLEIKDFFWYGRGPSLALFPGAAERIKLYVRHVSHRLYSAFLLGVFVALVELPCTGAVYLAILSMMSLSGVNPESITLLVAYNVIFVLPLIVILFLFHHGITGEQLESWRKKNRRLMRLSIGLLLLFLGGWMIATAL